MASDCWLSVHRAPGLRSSALMDGELLTRNRGPALLLTMTRDASTTSVTVPMIRGGLRELLALALELAHFPFVPDLLGLDIPLVRLDLPQLLAEFKVAGFEIADTLHHLDFQLVLVALDLAQLLPKLLAQRPVQAIELFRSLGFC